MIDFFQMVGDFFVQIWNFVTSLIESLISFIDMVISCFASFIDLIARPIASQYVRAFALFILAICIIKLIVGRDTSNG